MNVLILTGKFGMGHMSAARTLAAEIEQSHLAANVIIEDIYEWIFPGCCDVLYGAYSSMVGKGCKLYNLAYKKTTSYGKSEKNRRSPLQKHFMKALSQVLEARKPDVVIATYSLCSQLMAEHKKETGSSLPLVTCITDVTTHSVWTNCQTDLYLVASESTKASLVANGIPAERIKISGIPVRGEFRCAGERRADRVEAAKAGREMGDGNKHLLIMGGGLGLLPENTHFYEELDQVEGLSTTVITGKNRKLYVKLSGRFKNINVLGFTDEVDRYMREADLIISKPGGITLFEAIHSGVPMLVFRPFLEQEIKNGAFIEENELGIVIEKKPEKSVAEIREILAETERLSRIRENMKRLRDGLDDQALLSFLARISRGQLRSIPSGEWSGGSRKHCEWEAIA